MTTKQKKARAAKRNISVDKLQKAMTDERLETLKRAEAEALKEVKHYEYWKDQAIERYKKVKKARVDFENELKQG